MQWVNAIHALESVGYRVNLEVLKIAEVIEKDKSRRLPDSLEDFEERVKTFDDLTGSLDKEDPKRKEAESDRKELVNAQKAIRSRRSTFTRAIKRANEKKGSIFYHRVFADYRGRLYLTNSGLSYQGNDLQRGLIEFAQGRKVAEADWKFIWLHLANT
jgi:DNA-directed RNA polymerase